jgi:uncharacterized protein
MSGGSLLLARASARSFVLVALSLCGCAGHAAHTLEARKALDRHDPVKALELYNKELEVASGKELPKETGGDNAVFLLDRAMISQQLQAYENSSQDLESSDKQVEMLDYSRSTADEIGRYLFSDDVGPYKARPFEKLMINTTNMVNYLARGHLQGAKVEARRLAVMQKYLSQVEGSPDAALLGPGSYLAGFVFEMAREHDEAIRYYDEALKFAPYATLQEPIRQVAQYSGYRSPRLTPIVQGGAPAAPDPNSGEVLVVLHYGRVPALIAERVPIGAALTVAGVFLAPAQNQAARRMAGQGLVTWVNYPSLEAATRAYGPPVVQVDAQPVPVDIITDVDALVHAAYEKAKGPIMASAVTRMITRAAVGAAAGTAAGRGSGESAIGMLVALGTQAAMTAADTPDTRCWATLPARIAFARMRLAAGRHKLRVAVPGVARDAEIDVRAGGFVVVNLTDLSRM